MIEYSKLVIDKLCALLGHDKQVYPVEYKSLLSNIDKFFKAYELAGNSLPNSKRLLPEIELCATNFLEEEMRGEKFWPHTETSSHPVWSQNKAFIIEAIGHIFRRKAISRYIRSVEKVSKSRSRLGKKRTRNESDDDESFPGYFESATSLEELRHTTVKPWNELPGNPNPIHCSDYIHSLNPLHDAKYLTDFTLQWLTTKNTDWPESADRRLQNFMHKREFYVAYDHGEDVPLDLVNILRKGTEIETMENGLLYTEFRERIHARVEYLTNRLVKEPFLVLEFRRDGIPQMTKRFSRMWIKRDAYWEPSSEEGFAKTSKRKPRKVAKFTPQKAQDGGKSDISLFAGLPKDILASTANCGLAISQNMLHCEAGNEATHELNTNDLESQAFSTPAKIASDQPDKSSPGRIYPEASIVVDKSGRTEEERRKSLSAIQAPGRVSVADELFGGSAELAWEISDEDEGKGAALDESHFDNVDDISLQHDRAGFDTTDPNDNGEAEPTKTVQKLEDGDIPVLGSFPRLEALHHFHNAVSDVLAFATRTSTSPDVSSVSMGLPPSSSFPDAYQSSSLASAAGSNNQADTSEAVGQYTQIQFQRDHCPTCEIVANKAVSESATTIQATPPKSPSAYNKFLSNYGNHDQDPSCSESVERQPTGNLGTSTLFTKEVHMTEDMISPREEPAARGVPYGGEFDQESRASPALSDFQALRQDIATGIETFKDDEITRATSLGSQVADCRAPTPVACAQTNHTPLPNTRNVSRSSSVVPSEREDPPKDLQTHSSLGAGLSCSGAIINHDHNAIDSPYCGTNRPLFPGHQTYIQAAKNLQNSTLKADTTVTKSGADSSLSTRHETPYLASTESTVLDDLHALDGFDIVAHPDTKSLSAHQKPISSTMFNTPSLPPFRGQAIIPIPCAEPVAESTNDTMTARKNASLISHNEPVLSVDSRRSSYAWIPEPTAFSTAPSKEETKDIQAKPPATEEYHQLSKIEPGQNMSMVQSSLRHPTVKTLELLIESADGEMNLEHGYDYDVIKNNTLAGFFSFFALVSNAQPDSFTQLVFTPTFGSNSSLRITKNNGEAAWKRLKRVIPALLKQAQRDIPEETDFQIMVQVG